MNIFFIHPAAKRREGDPDIKFKTEFTSAAIQKQGPSRVWKDIMFWKHQNNSGKTVCNARKGKQHLSTNTKRRSSAPSASCNGVVNPFHQKHFFLP